MPVISRFYGILIKMYFNDHLPPHFHAIYGQDQIQVSINPINILRGGLPRRAESMVFEWAALHQQELMDNWNRLDRDQSPEKIKPLK